ncbi:MAG: hypothetical protein ABIC40_05120, partial [bacterium]
MLSSSITMERKTNRITSVLVFIILLIIMLPGCNGSNGPSSPAVGNDDSNTPELQKSKNNPASETGKSGGKALWGFWDVSFDHAAGLQIVPLRGIEYTFDINSFLQPPKGSLTNMTINVINMEKLWNAGDVTVDISLTHPFPGLTQFTGFDVLGVFIGKGDYVANSDLGILYANPANGAVLKNADGYTRWMNPLEFKTPGILGFTEGARGLKNQYWNATLNPYKYFADGLYTTESIVDDFKIPYQVNNRGLFSPGSTNTRRYDIHFPMFDGKPVVKFQYVVLASWAEPSVIPPQAIPGDFPAKANMQEAFYCDISTVGSTVYWVNKDDNGGNLFLTLQIFDWQGMGNPSGVAGEIKRIILDSPDEFINGGSKLVMTDSQWTVMAGDCPNSIKLAIDVGAVHPGGPCPYDNDVLVTIVTKEMGDYDNGFGASYPTDGVLSGYARLFYDMGNVCNDPPVVWFENCPDNPLTVANRTFRWDAEDDVTPNTDIEFRWKYDDDDWSDWETNLKQAYLENMAEKDHVLTVEASDSDGQVGTVKCIFSVDLPPEHMPPNLDFTNCTAYVRTANKTFHLDISDDYTPLSMIKVRYQLDGSPWTNLPDGTVNIPVTGMASGEFHSLIVEIEDLDEMTDSAQCDWTVNFPPNVTIDDCPSQDVNVNSCTFNWTGTDPEGDTLQYSTKVDTAAWSGWGTNTMQVVNGLTAGNHVFYVQVRDITNGTDQAQCNFKVNFGPSISITNQPTQDVNTTSYIFQWTATDDLDSPLTMQYNVQKDGVWQGWAVGTLTYNWSSLTSGNHTFRIRVRDTGNPQLTAEDVCNFLVNYKPTVNITNCPAGMWPSPDLTMTWTGVDDNSPAGSMDYSYKLDANPWSPWQLGQLSTNLSGLTNAAHTFSVRVRDTGTPQLYCSTPPDSCDVCNFTVDTSCAFPPPDVTNFSASDAD